jgi:hypothetical protein
MIDVALVNNAELGMLIDLVAKGPDIAVAQIIDE